MKAKADFLFEVSWEACNKVGGIYTVISSKAKYMVKNYENYFLIGPYFEKNAKESFLEEDPPADIKKCFDELENDGIKAYYGKWQIAGEPRLILFDFSSIVSRKNEFKTWMWENYKIDSIYSDWGFEEPLIWSYAVSKFLHLFSEGKKRKTVGHFHEWLAGFCILFLKKMESNVATVFTTHATMLGRSIAGSGEDLYGMLDSINPDEQASQRKVQDKYLTEKACAANADIFTTVSEITQMEAEKILGRKAEVLLLNGFDIDKFPTFEETSKMHQESKDVIREFVSYYFFPYYSFELEKTFYFFIVGRNEYKNKGLDIFTKALARLNARLKKEGSDQTIVVFFWIPRDVNGTKLSVSQSRVTFNQLDEFAEEYLHDIKSSAVNTILKFDVASIEDPNKWAGSIFSKSFMQTAKKLKLNFQKEGNPPLVTHNLPYESDDTLIKGFLENGLDNNEDDRVKIVYYPVYLNGVDGLLNLAYYDAMAGCHFGVFPSYYEPWGYTPLESAAIGVPSLTTDFGGFGRFILSKSGGNSGTYVLKRFNRREDHVIKDFAEILYRFIKMPKEKRVKQKMIAKEQAHLADWKGFIDYYIKAHNLAVDKKWS